MFVYFCCSSFAFASNETHSSFTAAVGEIDVDNKAGLNTVFSLEYINNNLIVFTNFIDMEITSEDNERYYMDKFSNGEERCRDRTNGQFAKSESCDPIYHYDYALSLDANYSLQPDSRSFFLGGGLRIGQELIPYASVGYAFNELSSYHCYIKAAIGEDLYQTTIGYSF